MKRRPFAWLAVLGKLRAQLAVIIAAALLPAGIVAVLQAVANADNELAQRQALLRNDARLRASQERDLLIEVRESIRNTALNVAEEFRETGSCDIAFDALETGHAWSLRAILLNHEGRVTCGAPEGFSVADLPEWRDEFRPLPRFTIGPVRTGILDDARIMVAYQPVPGGEPDAFAIGVGIDMRALSRLASTKESSERPFALYGNGGPLLVVGDSAGGDWTPAETDALFSYRMIQAERPGSDGVMREYVSHPIIPGQVWALTGAVPLGFGDLMLGMPGLAILTPVLLWVIAVSVAYVTIDRLVTRHVQHLQKVATRIGQGEFDSPIRPLDRAPVEIERLGTAIREMAQRLSERDARLRELLSTQKSLLLEVHHRVKNNLQMISSLMNIQIRRLPESSERGALQLVQDRIHGLALVHQNLYAAERLDHVALDQLVRDLSAQLTRSLSPAAHQVDFEFALDEVTVEAAVATPVALFLTEAMGNVFKHAVAPGRRTTVAIRLERTGGSFSLAVTNPCLEGAGAPARGPSGLGTRLMHGFARQLGGSLDTEADAERYSVRLTAPMSVREKNFAIRSMTNGAPPEEGWRDVDGEARGGEAETGSEPDTPPTVAAESASGGRR